MFELPRRRNELSIIHFCFILYNYRCFVVVFMMHLNVKLPYFLSVPVWFFSSVCTFEPWSSSFVNISRMHSGSEKGQGWKKDLCRLLTYLWRKLVNAVFHKALVILIKTLIYKKVLEILTKILGWQVFCFVFFFFLQFLISFYCCVSNISEAKGPAGLGVKSQLLVVSQKYKQSITGKTASGLRPSIRVRVLQGLSGNTFPPDILKGTKWHKGKSSCLWPHWTPPIRLGITDCCFIVQSSSGKVCVIVTDREFPIGKTPKRLQFIGATQLRTKQTREINVGLINYLDVWIVFHIIPRCVG